MPLALRAAGRGEPPFPPNRRDIGRLAASLRSPPKAVPLLPLLTLEGCPKDGVVSAPYASLTLIVSQASPACFFSPTT